MATIKYNGDGITIDGENIATEDYVDSVASGMTVIVSNSTVNTSNLPAISVPALTGANIDAIISAFSNGKGVIIKKTSIDGTVTHGCFTVEEVDLENYAVDIAWYDYFLTYEKNGTGNAIVTYKTIGGSETSGSGSSSGGISGGTKLYKHYINGNALTLVIITNSATQIVSFSALQTAISNFGVLRTNNCLGGSTTGVVFINMENVGYGVKIYVLQQNGVTSSFNITTFTDTVTEL